MATYIPNATQTTEPVESRTVESAALEFRTLKTSINERIEDVQDGLDAEIVNRIAGDANLQTQNNAQDVRLTAIENALPFIGEGVVPGTVYVQRFSGTGVQTAFTLDVVPHAGNVVDIYVNGLYQNKDTFSVAGAVITFSEAPPAGTDNIEVQVTVTIALGETDASLVTYNATTVEAQLDAVSAAGGSSLVGFQQAGAGAVARTAQDKMREQVSVEDFGASSQASAASNTSAINKAIDYAASFNLGLSLAGKSYPIQNIRIKNGLRFLRDGELVPSGAFGEAAVEFDGGTLGGATVSGVTIAGVSIDCLNGPKRAIYGEGVSTSIINENVIYNIDSSAGTIGGIMLVEGAHSNTIAWNEIKGTYHDTSGVMIGLYSAGEDSYYGWFNNANGLCTAPINPCYDNKIIGNKITGGQQNIWLSGTRTNIVVGNTCRGARDRGIILINSLFCSVVGNECLGYRSSGIHMAYGSLDNVISGNNVQSSVSVGESGIQCYVGCHRNLVVGNKISTSSIYGIYVAVTSSQNHFTNNHILGYRLAGIGIESDWTSPLPANAKFSRPSFGAPVSGSRWAFAATTNNLFSQNYIAQKGGIDNSAAIYLAQIKSYDGTTNFGLVGNSFKDNHIASATNTFDLYSYSEISEGISGGVFVGNTILEPSTSRISATGGNTTWRSNFKEVSNNSLLDSVEERIGLPSGSSTPFVGNAHFFQCQNASATTITNFDGGTDGQEIVLRLDVNTSIAHNSSFVRLRSGMNITGVDSNSFVSLRNVNGIWFELWRSF